MTLANARITSILGSPVGYFFKQADCRYDHLLFAGDTASLTVPVEAWRGGQRQLLTSCSLVNCMMASGNRPSWSDYTEWSTRHGYGSPSLIT